MKVMTIAGTRPELIRLSRIIPALDEVCEHTFVWTGQNYDPKLSDLFFEELAVRKPDEVIFDPELRYTSFASWVGAMIDCVKPVLERRAPDKVLILGDTNSAMSSYVAKRMGIPVYHMEAGNRCYDDRVPEEVNRRVIDACSSVLLPYTHRSRDNLLAEGYEAKRIFVTGNPISEVMEYYKEQRPDMGGLLDHLGIGSDPYFLVTLHRAENVDDPARLSKAVDALRGVRESFEHRMLVSVHPRTRSKLKDLTFTQQWDDERVQWHGIDWLDPLGFHEFVALEEGAFCVLTDSGTVQEECCLLGTPAVTLRESTERPETVECGSNVVCGLEPRAVKAAVKAVTKRGRNKWAWPADYFDTSVSDKVVNILLSKEAL
jgi:UDP-N-acetylglucosamine 2-epimerase (non-hydrolysing)